MITSCETDAGLDGEGCAKLSIDAATVGENSRFYLTFMTGKSGIPVGGSISIGFHHASFWDMQVDRPRDKNLIRVTSGNKNIVLSNAYNMGHEMFLKNSETKFSDRIFNNIFVATVVDVPLEPNEVITFVFGANRKGQRAQTYADHEHEIRVTTDVDGDGKFARIADTIMFSVNAAPATQLSANTSSQIKVGTPFPILIRAEDAFFNVDHKYSGVVQIFDEHGNMVADEVEVVDGFGRASVSVSTAGPHRLRVAAKNGDISGRSNPIRSFETLPKRRLYWGDIHGHTGTSDGLGRSIDEYFRYGRDVAALDIIALTDHGHFDWEGTSAAVQKYYDPGHYVTILAQEAGAGPDHMNIYLRRDDADHISKWQNDYVEFQDWVYHQYNLDSNEAVTGPHHFAYERGGRSDPKYPFGYWDDRVARFIEVYSSHGTSEFVDNPRPLNENPQIENKFMQSALAQGLKFAVIGASDNHDSHPGRSGWGKYPGGLAGFWVDDLTRESVWDALWNYQTYATSFDRIYMEFKLNGREMGASITASGPLKLAAYVIGKTDKVSVSVIRDNEEIYTQSSVSGLLELDFEDEPPVGEHFYYLRVSQDNGERAWSTPIWVNQTP